MTSSLHSTVAGLTAAFDSRADGHFALAGEYVPQGKYILKRWHTFLT